MGATFGHLVDRLHRNARLADGSGRALGGHKLKAQSHELTSHHNSAWLVIVLDRQEHLAHRICRARQLGTRTELAFDESFAEGLAHAHHLAGGLHLRAEDGVHARELDEGEHRFLDAEVRRCDLLGHPLRGQRLAGHATRRHLGQGNARGLGHIRHGARRARVDFQHVDHVVAILLLDGELDVHQSHHLQGLGHGSRLALEFGNRFSRQRVRRQ